MKTNIEVRNCNISIGEKEIQYILRSSKKAKHLRLQIVENQLEVILPKRVSKKAAEKFIIEKSDWIKKNLKERKPKKHFFLGKEIILIQSFDLFLKEHQFNFRNNKLFILSPLNGNQKFL